MRENVLFGADWDAARYADVLAACALEPDLALLPAGDLTDVGERGVALSGGQRQRVALARALYSDSPLFLLDDPFSALDVHVGEHVFTHAIGPNGLLARRGATRVLVTHSLKYLSQCDLVVLMANGEIAEMGPPDITDTFFYFSFVDLSFSHCFDETLECLQLGFLQVRVPSCWDASVAASARCCDRSQMKTNRT